MECHQNLFWQFKNILAIQEYFGLQLSLSFGHPIIFLACQFPILACHLALDMVFFCALHDRDFVVD